MSGIQATRLRFGFFDGTTQWFHVSNLKIINSFGEDIMLNTGTIVTPTSTATQYQSPGDIKTILRDNNPDTFSHSILRQNEYIKVDFDKAHTIVQIILRNRPTSSVRILNVQFRLYNDTIVNNTMIYESNKITVDQQLYYILPPDKTIYTGEAPAMSVMSAPSKNYIFKSGLDQSGKTIDRLTGINISVDDCKKVCDSNSACAGLVYEPGKKDCWTISAFDADQVKNPIYDTYIKSRDYSFGQGLDQSGKTLRSLSNISVDNCKSECDKVSDCAGIVYEPGKQNCWTVNGFDANQVKNAQYDSYYKTYSTISARKLRIGFFDDGKKQFLHLASIRIISKDNLDIAKDSTFTQTSYWPGFEDNLKGRLIDQDVGTFNHTNNEANQYLTIDFGKNEVIKNIIIENRAGQYARLLDAQVKLYDENDNVVFISDKVTTSEQFYLLNLPTRTFVPSLVVGAILLAINAVVAAATIINDAKKKAEEAKILADKAKAETDAKNAEAARIKAEADAAALAAVEAQMKAEADALAAKTAAEKKAADEKKAIADKEAADALAIKKAADEVKAQAELQAKAAEDAKKAAEAQMKVAEEKEKLKKAQEAKEAAEKLAAENPTPANQAKVAQATEAVAVIEQTKTQAEEIQKEADKKAKDSLDVALLETPTPPPPPAPVATLGTGTIALIVVLVLVFLGLIAWILKKVYLYLAV